VGTTTRGGRSTSPCVPKDGKWGIYTKESKIARGFKNLPKGGKKGGGNLEENQSSRKGNLNRHVLGGTGNTFKHRRARFATKSCAIKRKRKYHGWNQRDAKNERNTEHRNSSRCLHTERRKMVPGGHEQSRATARENKKFCRAALRP